MNAVSTRTQIVILVMIVGLLASSPLTEAGASGSSIGSCLASETEVPLVTCGAIPGATGTRRFRVRTDCGRDLRVEILGAPAGNYPVLVAGTLRGTMVVGVLGQGEIEFDTSPDAGELLLDFDPAAEVDVNTPGGQLALSQSPDAACVSSSPPPPPTCTPAESLVSLVNSGDLPAATGTRRLRTREDCGQDLSVEVQDATPGKSYVVWVGGAVRGTITADVLGHGAVEFDNTPVAGQVLLDFDPTGEVDVYDGTIDAFSLTADADRVPPSPPPPPPSGSCAVSETFTPLATCGTIPDATGTRRMRTRTDCARNLEIEVEGVPAGSYTVSVGGAVRATITADALGNGQIEFDATPEAGQLVLDFDPTGEIDVAQGSNGAHVASLTADGTCPTSPPPTPTPAPPSGCTLSETFVSLMKCRAIAGATGRRQLRTRASCGKNLEIDIHGVAKGKYTLSVGGVVRGTIIATRRGSGHVDFDTTPRLWQRLLDFDPTGEIDIVRASTGARVLSLPPDTACTGKP